MIERTLKVKYDGRELKVATKSSQQSDDWIVFLHGIGCAKECFDEAFNTELAKGYSILTLDFVGFGASDKPDDFTYTLEDHANITKLVIDQFKPRKVILVAHSMGGTVGMLLARSLANLVSFINAEGNLVSEDAGIVSRKTAEHRETDFIKVGFNQFLEGLRSSSEPAFRTWAEWYGHSSKVAIYRSGCSLVEWSDSGKLMEYFNSLDKKAFIYGDEANVESLTKQFQDVEIFSIPNSGHFMMLDNPDAFYSAITKHLGS